MTTRVTALMLLVAAATFPASGAGRSPGVPGGKPVVQGRATHGVPARASGDGAASLANGITYADAVRSVAQQGAWVFYVVEVPPGGDSLVVDLLGLTGDADLYVRRNDAPDLEVFDVRSIQGGTTAERCAVTNTAPGLYWIGVNGYDTGGIGFDVRASWACGSVCAVANLQNGTPVSATITGGSQNGAWDDFFVALPEGATDLSVLVDNLTGDVDLYVRRLDLPDLGVFTCRSWQTGTAPEQCDVALPSSGLWWVSITNYDVGPIGYRVTATWQRRGVNGSARSDTIVATMAQESWNDTYVDLPAGATNLVVRLDSLTDDADLYLRRGAPPTTTSYDCRPFVNGLGAEQCAIAAPAAGTWWVSVNNYATGRVSYTLSIYWDCPGGCDEREGILIGLGPGAASPPRSSYVRHDTLTGSYAAGLNPYAHYGTLQAGVNVGGANLDDRGLGDYLTGPGNVAVFGPHVRGFYLLGSPLAKVNFFAYGTLKYGVKVRGLQGDTDSFDEILTGAGQGAVFGPHVRAFEYDGAVVQATPVSFFAYAGYRYGVNVEAADLDGGGVDEVLTAPVYGGGYPTNVRGWDVDTAVGVNPIPSIDFYAFTSPNDRGATVAGGDVDGDGRAEIIAGRGPAAGLGTDVAGFSWDGAAVYTYPTLSFTAWSGYSYGVNAALPDVDGDGNAEMVVVPGPDPTAPPVLRAVRATATGVVAVTGLDGLQPFATEEPAAREGGTIGVGP